MAERTREETIDLLARVRDVVNARNDPRTRVLDAIAWPRSVEENFFADGASVLPDVQYPVDRSGMDDRIAELVTAECGVEGDDPVAVWLRANLQSMVDAHRLVLAAGTREFHRLSCEIYGSARSRFRTHDERNIDLAEHLLQRMTVHGWDEAADPDDPTWTAETLAAELRRRIALHYPGLVVDVIVDDTVAAKVVAGMTRIRVRRGARFLPWEADGLWHHEVETHVLTAHNGAVQEHMPFLRAGGPRSTRTQEGLAVFAELHNHSLTTARMERLARRVTLIAMAEDGANFIDLYRSLVARGAEAREAYLDAQRICRGGLVTGGAPFTKDACYLAGLLEVHAFLTAVVRGGFRDECELLACGRIDLDDVHALVALRQLGVLSRPKYLPTWLRRWRTLLPEYAFGSFVGELRMSGVAEHYQGLIALAEAAAPPAPSSFHPRRNVR